MFREELSSIFRPTVADLTRAVTHVNFTQERRSYGWYVLCIQLNGAILKLGPAPHTARLRKHSRRTGRADRLRNVGPARGAGHRIRGFGFAGFSPGACSSCPIRVAGRTGYHDRSADA